MILKLKSTNTFLLHYGSPYDVERVKLNRNEVNDRLYLLMLGIMNIFIIRNDNSSFNIYIYDYSMQNVGTEREIYLRAMHRAGIEEVNAISNYLNSIVDKEVSFDHISSNIVDIVKRYNSNSTSFNYVWSTNNPNRELTIDTIPSNFKLTLSLRYPIIKKNEFLFEGLGRYTSFVSIDKFFHYINLYKHLENFVPKILYNSKGDKYKLKKHLLHTYYRPDLYSVIDKVMKNNVRKNIITNEPIFPTLLEIKLDNIYNYNVVRTFGSKAMVFGGPVNGYTSNLDLNEYTKSLLNHLITSSNIESLNNSLYYPFMYKPNVGLYSVGLSKPQFDNFVATYNSIAYNYCLEYSEAIEAIESYFLGKFRELIKLVEIMMIDNMIDNYLSWDLTILDKEASELVNLVSEVIELNSKFSDSYDDKGNFTKIDTALMYLNVLYGFYTVAGKGVSAANYKFDMIVPLLTNHYGKLELNTGALSRMPNIDVTVKGHYMIWLLNNVLNKNFLED